MSRVKEIFRGQGWTGNKLAAYFGVSKCYISQLLSGKSRAKVMQRSMARLLGMPPEALWGDILGKGRKPHHKSGCKNKPRRPHHD